MTTLTEVSTPSAAGDTFQLEMQPGWRQGRGAFGGLTIAAMIRAIEHRLGDPERKLRSVTAELFAPFVPGAAEITVDTLRRGSSVTALRALTVQGGAPIAHAVALAARTRAGAGPLSWQDLACPDVPPWTRVEPIGLPAGMAPEFSQHFEYRLVDGIPMSRGARAVTVGWIRPRAPGPARDAGYIAALADAWWPAALVRLDAMRPIATIAYTLDLVGGVDGLDPESPLLYRGTVPVMMDGYFLETRELWGEDGRLVAINQQTFAVIQ